ncbi:hypothetical protein WMF30_29455 [Sorangium sp. So ce134]
MAGMLPYGITLADINGDAKRDLVIANAFSSDVSVFIDSTH